MKSALTSLTKAWQELWEGFAAHTSDFAKAKPPPKGEIRFQIRWLY